MKSSAHSLTFICRREEEEDKLIGAMLKKKGRTEAEGGWTGVGGGPWHVLMIIFVLPTTDFQKDPHGEQQQQHQKKKGAKFKPIKVLKRLSHKGEAGRSPNKDKTP